MIRLASDRAEKTILDIMHKFDEDMTSKMTLNSIMLHAEMNKVTRMPGDLDLSIRSLKTASHFRIKFKLPVLLYFHDSTKFMRKKHYVKVGTRVFPMGFIPVYNCNLNHMTVFWPYRKTTRWLKILNNSSSSGYVARMFDNTSGTPMQLSSMNFLLQYNSVEKRIDKNTAKILGDCFTYQYWRPPVEDFQYKYSTIHNMIHHNTAKIIGLSRIYKTIVKFDDLSRKKYFHGEREYVRADCKIMCQDTKGIFFRSSSILVDKSDAVILSSGDIASCILEIPIVKGSKNEPLRSHSIINNIMKNNDFRNQISILLWKLLARMKPDSKLCKTYTTDSIMNAVRNMGKSSHVFDKSWRVNFEQKFNKSLEMLYPMFFDHKGTVYHTPAPLISYVLCKGMSILDPSEKDELINLLDFVDLMTPKIVSGGKFKLRVSEPAKRVQSGKYGNMWNDLMTDLPRVASRIAYSRLFSQASCQ
ncbi:MAG: hypothetical protein MPI91_04710 [Nitrosopumilus sp.]|nr:hypothetical protein [Nitrosopumilus sp.]